MASQANSLSFAIRAINEASAVLKAVDTDIDRIGGTSSRSNGFLSGFGSSLGGVAKIASGFVVGAGLLQLPGLLSGMVSAASEDEAATARLGQSLKLLNDRTDGNAASLRNMTADMEKRITAGQKLAFGDDDVRDSMQKLIAATDDYTEAGKRQALAMDLARGAGIPLADASKLLGKINEDNVQVFKRMGITLADNATEAEALAAVQAKFGGQAEAYAKSTAGQFEQTKIRLAEIGEGIGGYLLPLLATLGGFFLDSVLPRVESFVAAVGPLFARVGSWVEENILPRLREFGAFFMEQIWPRVEEFVGIAMTKLGEFIAYFQSDILPALDKLTQPFQDAINFVIEHWPEIMLVIGPMLELLQNSFTTAFKVVTGLIDGVIKLINGDFSGAWKALQGVVKAIWDGIEAQVRISVNAIIGIVNRMIDGLNGVHIRIPGTDIDLSPNIPRITPMATGGIVSRPTLALIGEAGPEAVVPLSRGGAGFGETNNFHITVNALDSTGAADAVYRVLEQLMRDGRVPAGSVI